MPYHYTCGQCGALFGGYQRRRRYHTLCRPCRFWARVGIGERDECWPWLGPIDRFGYGITGMGTTPDVQRSNRAAWTFTNGDIPPGQFVCHTCDNRSCCNPGHLWLGTGAENTADREAKGRSARNFRPMPGEQHGMSRLTASDILTIRKRVACGETRISLSREYGISYTHIKRIVRGKNWSHV